MQSKLPAIKSAFPALSNNTHGSFIMYIPLGHRFSIDYRDFPPKQVSYKIQRIYGLSFEYFITTVQ